MIIINKSGYLKYKNLKFRCSLGKAGVREKLIEGDNVTPKGTFKIIKIYYRIDRLKNLYSQFKLIRITKNMGWCDDPRSKKYNQLIRIPTKYSHEKLYRDDNLYDLVLVLNFNLNPTIKKRGSAIFIHIKKGNYKKTKGCIALNKQNLVKLVNMIPKDTKVIIN